MLQPIANIVITVFPETLNILLDFSIPVNMEEVFDDLVRDKLGIECSIGKETCSVTYTRIWRGGDIARELRRIIEAHHRLKGDKDKVFSVYCQIEGEGVQRTEIG